MGESSGLGGQAQNSRGHRAGLQVRNVDTVLAYRYIPWTPSWPTGMSLRNRAGLQVCHLETMLAYRFVTWTLYWPTGTSRGQRDGL